MEDEEKKRAKKRMAVRIMSPEEQHPGIMEYFRRNLGAPERMISLKNSVYVEVFGETAGGRLLRLNNVEWRRGEKLKLQMIPARMSLDSIIQYVSVELKLNSENEVHIQDRHNHGNHDRREDRHHPEVQDDRGGSSEDAGGESMTREDHEEAHFFAFVAHNTKEHGQDKSKWRRAPPRERMGKPPRRIGNPPLSFKEYRREHDGCWICYRKNLPHKHDHKTCKIYAEDKKAYFQAHPEKVPKEKRIEAWKRRQSAGGRSGGQGHGGDRRIGQIEEVADSLMRGMEALKALQNERSGQWPGDSQQDGAESTELREAPTGVGHRRTLLRKLVESNRRRHLRCRRSFRRSQTH